MGLVYFGLWGLDEIDMTFDVTMVCVITVVSGACVAADYLFFVSMERGVVGVVVAIIASNFVLVTLLSHFCYNESALTVFQVIGICSSVVGVVLVSAGDMLIPKKPAKDIEMPLIAHPNTV